MAQPARSAASALGRFAQKVGDARSLFIRVEPAPTSLAERRAVLRTLQRHGQVEMFKKLHVRVQYLPPLPLPQPPPIPNCPPAAPQLTGIRCRPAQDDRSFVSIASSLQMARELVLRSPMRFELLTDKADAARPLAGSPGITSPVEPLEAAAAAETTPPLRRETRQLSQKAFVLHIHPHADYRHKTTIRRSPLHGPWPDDDGDARGSLVYYALGEVVPDGPARDALCDWQTGGQLSDRARLRRSQPSDYRSAHIQERLARRAHAARTGSLADILAASAAPREAVQAGEEEEAAEAVWPAGAEEDGRRSENRPVATSRLGATNPMDASRSLQRAGHRWGARWDPTATKDAEKARNR